MQSNYKNIIEVLEDRNDISEFVVHLTKDTNSSTALKDLLSIVRQKCIKASKHHCLFTPQLKNELEIIQKKYYSTCFTETPIDNIKLLLGISGRQINLQPYGLVFLKKTLIQKGGNPAIYLFQDKLKVYMHNLYNKLKSDDEFAYYNSFVNVVNSNHDFYWEREWRINGDFCFVNMDIIAIIAPKENHEFIRNELKNEAFEKVLMIDPKWSYKSMVFNVAEYFNDISPF